MVNPGQFVKVINDNFVEYGIEKGSYLYLAGSTFIPEKEQDPYLYRLVFTAARVVDGHIQADEKPFLIQGSSVELAEEDKVEEFQRLYEEDFGEK